MRKPSAQTLQLGLEGLTDENLGWFTCHGIFTANYIDKHLKPSNQVRSPQQVAAIYDQLKALWQSNYEGLRRRNEDYTRSQFIDAVLKALGWEFIPEMHLPTGEWQTKKRPDYCLFENEADRVLAAAMVTPSEVYSRSSSVIEAKQVGVPLDKAGSEKADRGQLPSQQIQDYLQRAKDGNGRYFNWAILTNGSEWRLYCERAANDASFGFRLAIGPDFCPIDEFRAFVTLFEPGAFAIIDKRCLLDDTPMPMATPRWPMSGSRR